MFTHLQTSHKKLKTAVRNQLLGMKFYRALRAMNIAEGVHTGSRKDGSEEFSHQVRQVALALQITPLLGDHAEDFICIIFLHDTKEDYGVSDTLITENCGEFVDVCVSRISKVLDGVTKTTEFYYGDMATCPVTAICKGIDRIDNLKTMKGAFGAQKQVEYMQETNDWVLPMLKKVRKAFPEYANVCELVKSILVTHISLYAYALEQSGKETTA